MIKSSFFIIFVFVFLVNGETKQLNVVINGVTTNSPPINPKLLQTNQQQLLKFIDERLAFVYPIIQKFKSIITSDPNLITKSWVGSDICNYKGFYCDNPPDNISATTVASIDFNGFHLSAPTLTGFLDQLPDIALFHANSNSFTGTLPLNITKLPYLYELDLSNNQFTGPFPMAILGMESLTLLDLRFNFFTGPVPAQIFRQNLDVLFINDNDFMQSIPDSVVDTHISYLTLADNKFSGPIPRGIFPALSGLTEVLLLNNELTGCLPYEVGFLKEAVVFDLGNNKLTGLLPFTLNCLENVEQLNLGGNLFYGMVPDLICGLEKMVNFSLNGNYFTQVGPMCRVLIEKGFLDVRDNCIIGLPMQRSIFECAKFFAQPRFICPRNWSYGFLPCKFSHFPFSSSAIP